MKLLTLVGSMLLLYSAPNQNPSNACDYAGANIGYIKSNTNKALSAENLNTVKYFTYKAINGFEKSKLQLTNCGCEKATNSIDLGLSLLINASKANTLVEGKKLLTEALLSLNDAIDTIEKHFTHKTVSKYNNNTTTSNVIVRDKKTNTIEGDKQTLKTKIDSIVSNFEVSVQRMIFSLDCKEALRFTKKKLEECDQQLLKQNLSEGKRYYNLKTRSILLQALTELKTCN